MHSARARHGPYLTEETRAQGLKRLARIEGQVRGIQRMIAEDRYCVDVLIQLDAVRGALREVSQLVLRNYLSTCVTRAIGEGHTEILEELMTVLQRMEKE